MRFLILTGALIMGYGALWAQLSTESSWRSATPEIRAATFELASEYSAFLDVARTELRTVREVVRIAGEAGFRPLEPDSPWRPGARYYDINRDRTVCLIVAGEEPLAEGARVIASHIDSPRLELKAQPLYEEEGLALFQTVYHGGIKKYQWVNLPLALDGRVDKTNGTTTWLSVGTEPGDPVFLIPDLAPHVDRDNRSRTASEAIQGEELDPLAGSIPGETTSVEQQVMAYLQATYGMSAADFVSSEFSLVPALAPADVGFDRGLLAAYGHDDRACAFASLRASLAVSGPRYTTISFLADNEESGSNNNTGARSDYLRGLIHRLLRLETGEMPPELELRSVLAGVQVLSADVTTGVNPQYPGVQEASNAAKLGRGVVIKRYGRGNDPNSEFTARFRGLLERGAIPYQTHTYKVDVGGGGTLGQFLSQENMEVLDCGVPLLSMHSPYSVCSKIDLWWLAQAFEAFYRQ